MPSGLGVRCIPVQESEAVHQLGTTCSTGTMMAHLSDPSLLKCWLSSVRLYCPGSIEELPRLFSGAHQFRRLGRAPFCQVGILVLGSIALRAPYLLPLIVDACFLVLYRPRQAAHMPGGRSCCS